MEVLNNYVTLPHVEVAPCPVCNEDAQIRIMRYERGGKKFCLAKCTVCGAQGKLKTVTDWKYSDIAALVGWNEKFHMDEPKYKRKIGKAR